MKIVLKKHKARIVLAEPNNPNSKTLEILDAGEILEDKDEEIPYKQDEVVKNANYIAGENEKVYAMVKMGKTPETGEFDIFLKYLV